MADSLQQEAQADGATLLSNGLLAGGLIAVQLISFLQTLVMWQLLPQEGFNLLELSPAWFPRMDMCRAEHQPLCLLLQQCMHVIGSSNKHLKAKAVTSSKGIILACLYSMAWLCCRATHRPT